MCSTAVIKLDAINEAISFLHINSGFFIFTKIIFLKKYKDQTSNKTSSTQHAASKKIKDCKNKLNTKKILKVLTLLKRSINLNLPKLRK